MNLVQSPVALSELHTRLIVPSLGLMKSKDGLTYGITILRGVPDSQACQCRRFPDLMVIAELWGIRYGASELVGYSILSADGNLVQISVSDVPRYIDRVAFLDLNDPEVLLGLRLKCDHPVNRIYMDLLDEDNSSTKGYRLASGEIKVIQSDAMTLSYIQMLTNDDLCRIYRVLNERLFANKCSNDVKVMWSDQGIANSQIELVPDRQNIRSQGIMDYAVSGGVISLGREFCKKNYSLFYEILLHEMIHAMGITQKHGKSFERWVSIVNAGDTSLEVQPVDVYEASLRGKWAKLALRGFEEHSYLKVFCPSCNRIMRPKGRDLGCACGQTLIFKEA